MYNLEDRAVIVIDKRIKSRTPEQRERAFKRAKTNNYGRKIKQERAHASSKG